MHIFEIFVYQQLPILLQQLLHYTLVQSCSLNLQKVLNTITVDTGSKGDKEDVHYIDTKEHQITFMKNLVLGCI